MTAPTDVPVSDSEFVPVSYRRAKLDERYDAIVIGSGIGGLTAAVLLAKHAGQKVLVLERHYTAGGLTHAFTRPHFEWDVGVHYVGQVNDARSATAMMVHHVTEGRLQWAPMPDVYDCVVLGDRRYDFPTGRERFRAQMHGYFPRDTRAIDQYLKAMTRCTMQMGFFYAERFVPPWLATVAGPLMRGIYLRRAGRTTASVLNDFTTNRELIGVLTGQWGDYGLTPGQSSFAIHAILARHYLDGAAYPVGGASAILAAMAPTITAAGGTIVVRAEVDSVVVEDGAAVGVRMADGIVIRAPVVISNAGASNTYSRLVREKSDALDHMRRDLGTLEPSPGHLCLYIGLEGSAEDLQLSATNRWVCPSEDHDGNIRRFFADPEADFPVLYFSFPSAKDPSFATRLPGHSTIDLITYAPYEWFTRWEGTRWRKRGVDYDEFKQRLEARLLEGLYREVPAARGRVVLTELSTPLTTRHFTNYARGEIYGIAHTPDRFRSRALVPRTPVRGLYMTGQDAAVCGVVGAMSGGVCAVSAILRRNMFLKVAGRKPS